MTSIQERLRETGGDNLGHDAAEAADLLDECRNQLLRDLNADERHGSLDFLRAKTRALLEKL